MDKSFSPVLYKESFIQSSEMQDGSHWPISHQPWITQTFYTNVMRSESTCMYLSVYLSFNIHYNIR